MKNQIVVRTQSELEELREIVESGESHAVIMSRLMAYPAYHRIMGDPNAIMAMSNLAMRRVRVEESLDLEINNLPVKR